jgi:hypothetical protein
LFLIKAEKKYHKNMSRNNEKNIKKYNDKLHKKQDKSKKAIQLRKEKLKKISQQFNTNIKEGTTK